MKKHLDKRRQNSESLDLEDLKIPEFVWTGDGRGHSASDGFHIPKCPVLVFINTKSGGQLGKVLLQTCKTLLDSRQLFDLSEEAPDKVLDRILKRLKDLTEAGDEVAGEIRERLRLVVAGGDGTAGWLLGIMGDLRLEKPIPIATIPLGTGNNLPFSFGWGKKNPGTDAESVKRFLADVMDAHPLQVDSWHLAMKMEGTTDLGLEAPHSLHVFKKSEESREKLQIYRGGFWNYFSIGMDAQVSYEFHEQRQKHPEKFSNQMRNQCTYAKLGCTQGWFCPSCRRRASSKNINDLATVYVLDKGKWTELKISSSIRALVLLNLPSFSGGLDPWGNPDDKLSHERGLTVPRVDDGLLEIVGFRDAWHGLFLLFPHGHGTRLAQANRVKIVFQAGSTSSHTYMRMDGEPWKQPLPESHHGNPTEIEISHHGQAVMLAKEGCIAEAKDEYQHVISFTRHGVEHGLRHKPVAPQDDSSGSDDDETKRKFGAASTFRA
ncbi:diacylglycerol kinase 6 [Selaginella moellendorffii]|uniref:diacylglycerol kinase 6 n=1 Tax=Selaginella moellendorffii TaxID=88036 RepID=UPI000D1D11A5|nr:diacylglycerol kinase 6 [Selaginella moellendorffii]|eukprot:XP_024522876.1 diacylglycerol kinase 6 [Selaginella moellendorffii]